MTDQHGEQLPDDMDAYELWERFGQQHVGDAVYYIFDNGYGALVWDNEERTRSLVKLCEHRGREYPEITHHPDIEIPVPALGRMFRTEGIANVLNKIRLLPAIPKHEWLNQPPIEEDEPVYEVDDAECAKRAERYADMLVKLKRNDGSEIFIVDQNAPERDKERLTALIREVGNAVYGAEHFPPDALWEGVRTVLLHMSENEWDDTYDFPVDVYTRDLNRWMIAHSDHREKVWELLEESIMSETYGRQARLGFKYFDVAIMAAQDRWLCEIAEVVRGIVEEHVTEDIG